MPARDRVPMILAAGRTPITEKGLVRFAPRPIHWAQEMFDQAGMVREMVKWDYELRQPGQTGDMVARAVEVAMARPRGPVYLVLPREPLSAPLAEPLGPIETAAAGGAGPSRPESHRDTGRMDRGAPSARCIIAATLNAPMRWRRSPNWPNAAPFRSSRTTRARSACRRAIRCISASSPARCSPTPIW